MNRKKIFSIGLLAIYFIMGVATSQAPRHMASDTELSPVNINHSKHILYYEPFNSNKNNWPEGQFDSIEHYFDNGKYIFSNQATQALSIQNIYPDKVLIESKDWVYETAFSINSQEQNGTAYLLWGKNGLDFEGFGFSQENNQSYIWHGKRVAGLWTGSKTAVNHYTKNNTSILLSVHKVNDRLDFYLNRRLRFSKPVSPFAGNELAIAVEGQMDVAFDQITLKQLQFLNDGKSYNTDRSRVNYSEENKELVPMRKVGENYLIPIYINGAISAQFVYDQWTADVIVSEALAERLIKSGTVTDWIGDDSYRLKNKSVAKSSRFILNTLKVGKRSVQHVECMIGPNAKAEMLIGTSVLSQLGTYTLDAKNGVLVFDE